MAFPINLVNIMNPLFGDYFHEDLNEARKALEKLPPEARLHTVVVDDVPTGGGGGEGGGGGAGRKTVKLVDVRTLDKIQRQRLVETTFQTSDQDNGLLLLHMKERLSSAGIPLPTVEVRFSNLSIKAEIYVGSRALPTLTNFVRNMAEGILASLKILPSNKRSFPILKEVSGVLRPGRMMLLLGPPGAGRTTLLKALSGMLDKDLTIQGAIEDSKFQRLLKKWAGAGPEYYNANSITYNGHNMSEFVAQRTSAYVSQNDNHMGELTVRETLDFAARCQGVGYNLDMAKRLQQAEKESSIEPDVAIDAFMKGVAVEGENNNLASDYIMKVLGLDICSDTFVGNEMLRGISGGQKKRVTTGEMVVGSKRTLFMDEISTGLDSSTTFQVTKCMRNFVHLMEATVLIALLQPAPETYDLFDDILLLAEGYVLYIGPREGILDFFDMLGFKLPPRKGIADFLQEVTSKKDQQQYWSDKNKHYEFIPVESIAAAFKEYITGKELAAYLETPFDKKNSHPAALSQTKYALSGWELVKACTVRELTLITRHRFLYIFRTCQVGFVGFVTATLFIRTRIHPTDEQNGTLYMSSLFFALVHMMFNGFSEMAMTVLRLPILYKQRDNLFYPTWAFTLPSWILRLPYSIAESIIWSGIVYYVVGLAPSASRFFKYMFLLFLMHQMALGMFRLIGALGRTMVIANTFGSFALLVVFLLGGFILAKDSVHPMWIWGYWISPLSYAQNSIVVNEFLDERWNKTSPLNQMNLAMNILHSRGLQTKSYWYGIGVGVLVGYMILFNFLVTFALDYLNPLGAAQATLSEDKLEELLEMNVEAKSRLISRSPDSPSPLSPRPRTPSGEQLSSYCDSMDSSIQGDTLERDPGTKKSSKIQLASTTAVDISLKSVQFRISGNKSPKGMILPFKPLSVTFRNISYYVDMPSHMKEPGGGGATRLQLLKKISGAFRPSVLTALVGVSGAGKTTLMDVLAGRKTGGYIEGDIKVSGFLKRQETFARISGYVEQTDIHSPQVTVFESLMYSSWLRLPSTVGLQTREAFVDEVMDLVELATLKGALVGLPGSTGLSTEQRKRLTIAVELVANPSIIFMDEPTSGLDARAAAIVMRTVRNTVDTGRTVVCTIHQPSIDIFEAFDELLLMKRGGQVIYSGALGKNSEFLIEYFQAIEGVPQITDGYNPATWMLEISTPAFEQRLEKDFAKIYAESDLSRRNDRIILDCNTLPLGAKDLIFSTQYSRNAYTQLVACLWKQHLTYWRSPYYNAVRFFFTVIVALMFGSIFYGIGAKRASQQDVFNVMGALYASVLFLGVNNAASVQPVVSIERSVFYRERAAGMYGPLPYAIAQGAIEIPYIFFQTLVYGIITYALIQFEWKLVKFFWYMLFMFMTFTYFTFYGMMAVGLTPSQQVAAVVSSAFYSLWNLFSGFLIPRPRMPGWWVWFYWISPVAWTLYGLITSQVGDVTALMVAPGFGDIPIKDFIHVYFGYRHDWLGICVVVLFVFILLFWSIFAFSIKFLNFQSR